MHITTEQQSLIKQPLRSKLFIQGQAGTGKTTAGVLWLNKLIADGVPAHQILVFVPQRSLAEPYLKSVRENISVPHSLINSITLGGLARRSIDLFWPLISQKAGFKHPNHPPHFLTLETAQYFMAHIVKPLIETERYFESLTITRNRIYSQILDNLNKSAIVGFPHQEIADRLKRAWIGSIEQLNIYDDMQSCANRFRQFCLEHTLLDFSLQVEIFTKHLWTLPLCRDYLGKTYRHLIVDNIEEDTPVAHDILRDWLPDFDSALVIFDQDAGFRSFLGANTTSAATLQDLCDTHLWFHQNLVNQREVNQLKSGVRSVIAQLISLPMKDSNGSLAAARDALVIPDRKLKYFPAMIQWAAEQVASLIRGGVPPGEIALLAPFMSDVLRFSLGEKLDALNIPYRSHRPSRALRDEPATKTLLTLAAVTYTDWLMLPPPANLTQALMQSIAGLDQVRAQLLINQVYSQQTSSFPLKPFDTVPPDVRERITYRAGERYDHLRNWLLNASELKVRNLDFFMSRLFGEVLSQHGYGFHNDLDNANTVAKLIESIQKFRVSVGQYLPEAEFELGKEYLQMVQDGVIAAQYLTATEERPSESVLLAPAFSFLIGNQPVDYQFWLDINSPSWYQRLSQPLTHPFVLSRGWPEGRLWSAEDELNASYRTLERFMVGLLNRCRKKVYVGTSAFDLRGYENRGLLVRIINDVWRQSLQEAA